MGKLKKLQSSAEFDAEAVAQGKCIGCHGGDLTGGMGSSFSWNYIYLKMNLKTSLKMVQRCDMPGGLITADADLINGRLYFIT